MFLQRVLGVFRFSVATFEEIEHDPKAISQAALLVMLVAFLSGLGDGIWSIFNGSLFWSNFLITLVWTMVGWLLWSAITYLVGTSVFGGKANLAEMMRVLGFAYAPLMLSVIPCIGPLVGGIWALAAGFIAVRQGLDLDDFKTVITILIGFVVFVIGRVVFSLFLC